MRIWASIIVIIIISSLSIATAQPMMDNFNGKYIQYSMSGNDIQNFSVKFEGRFVNVFNSISVTNNLFGIMNISGGLHIIDNYMTPIFYSGYGNVDLSINQSMKVSQENFSSGTEIALNNGSYFGALISNGQIYLEDHNISIQNDGPFYFFYYTLPVSYMVTQGSYMKEVDENEFAGNFSSYYITENGIRNYSLIGNNYSIDIISSISGLNTDDNMGNVINSITALDSSSPELVGTGYQGGYNITLSNPFTFKEISQTSLKNISFTGMAGYLIDEIPVLQTVYAISYNNVVIGTVNVFGHSYAENGSLVLPSMVSSFIVRFSSVNYTLPSSGRIANNGNVSLELFANGSSNYISLSPTAVVKSLKITNGSVECYLYLYQNSSIELFIPQDYRISTIVINGINYTYGNHPDGYNVIEQNGQYVAIININDTGNVSMAIALSKASTQHRIPLFPIFAISAVLLIAAAIGLIFYARRKSLQIYEKNI